MGGNLYDTEIETPRSDAGVGLLLQNTGNKDFESLPFHKTGLLAAKEIKAIVPIRLGKKGESGFIMVANNDSLKIVKLKGKSDIKSKTNYTYNSK